MLVPSGACAVNDFFDAIFYLLVELGKWWMAIRVRTGDTFALPLACALVVGRWGCFCNGCCYGTPTELPWGRDFGDGLLRHPTQAYESLFHLGMAVVLWVLLRGGWFRGHHLQIYLIAYGIYRFVTEYIRPEPIALGGLTFYQWISLVLSAVMLGQWWMQQRSTSAPLRVAANHISVYRSSEK